VNLRLHEQLIAAINPDLWDVGKLTWKA